MADSDKVLMHDAIKRVDRWLRLRSHLLPALLLSLARTAFRVGRARHGLSPVALLLQGWTGKKKKKGEEKKKLGTLNLFPTSVGRIREMHPFVNIPPPG